MFCCCLFRLNGILKRVHDVVKIFIFLFLALPVSNKYSVSVKNLVLISKNIYSLEESISLFN